MALLNRLALAARVQQPMIARCTVRAVAAVAPRAAWLHCSALAAAAKPAAAAAAAPVNPVKYTTNITGLDVVPNGREVLMGLLKETLASIASYNAALGFEPAHNESVRRLSEHRLQVCQQNESHAAIEKALWFGQIEELIQQAEDELDLLVTMNEEVKPWVEDPAMKAEVDELMSPRFGQTAEDLQRERNGQYITQTDAEKAAEEAFWGPIDAEIKAEQQKEAESRAAQRS